jgi:hypothetical protein
MPLTHAGDVPPLLLQAVEQRRVAGEYVPQSEEAPPRAPPGFGSYFEFDSRVASGLRGHQDYLLDEAQARRRPLPQQYASGE